MTALDSKPLLPLPTSREANQVQERVSSIPKVAAPAPGGVHLGKTRLELTKGLVARFAPAPGVLLARGTSDEGATVAGREGLGVRSARGLARFIRPLGWGNESFFRPQAQ
jgi:hypothetical protein